MSIRKIRAGRIPTISANEYIGERGTIFWNEDTGELRLSDGITPGGNTVIVGFASEQIAGSVKPGGGFTVSADATLSLNVGSMFELDINNVFQLKPATSSQLGGIKAGPGIEIASDGTLLIDSAGLSFSFGDFYASGNNFSTVNLNEDVNIVSNGTGTVNIVGNFSVYKTDDTVAGAEAVSPIFHISGDGQIQMLVPSADQNTGALEIVGSLDGVYQIPVNTGVMLHITGIPPQGGIATPSRLYNDAQGSYALYAGRRYNGTAVSPLPVLANEPLVRYAGVGYASGGWPGFGPARMEINAGENLTNTNQGGYLTFYATPNGQIASTNNTKLVARMDTTSGIVSSKLNVVNYTVINGHLNAVPLVINVSGASGTAGTATLTFSTQPFPPFLVGGKITVSSMNPAGYNANSVTVTACTTTSVSYSNATTATFVAGGIITGLDTIVLNSGLVGAIDNINIGTSTPGTGAFSALSASNVSSSTGVVSLGTFAGSFTDGVIFDYANSIGRISVGDNDGITFYKSANTTRAALLAINSNGNLTLSGNTLTISNATCYIVNTTATTVNFAGAATTLNIGNSSGTTTISGNLSVSNTISGSVSGNAGTATKLATTTNINGVSFDGSLSSYTLTAAAGTLTGTTLNSTIVNSSLTSVGALTSGSIGSGFTAIPNSALAHNSTTIGTTAISLGSSSTTLSGMSSITFAGATSGTSLLQSQAIAATTTFTLPSTTGTLIGTGDTGTVSNSMLSHSTISGVALGNNLNSLTTGFGLQLSSGTTYNGSSSLTLNKYYTITGPVSIVSNAYALDLGTANGVVILDNAGAAFTITISNPLAGRNIRVLVTSLKGNPVITISGLSASNSSNGTLTFTSNYGPGTTTFALIEFICTSSALSGVYMNISGGAK